MLLELLNNFIELLKGKKILQPLYKNKNIIVDFQTASEEACIIFKEGHCYARETCEDSMEDHVTIQCDPSLVERILTGQVQLTTLKNQDSAQVKGSNRSLLALESLFLLVNHETSLL